MISRFAMMFKRTAIVGLVLLLAGGGLFGWVLMEQRKDSQLAKQRSEILKSNLSKIGTAVGDEIDTRHFASIASENRIHEARDKRTDKEEKRELALTLSGVFALTGGVILGWWLLLGTARLIIGTLSQLRGFLMSYWRRRRERMRSEATDKASAQRQLRKRHTACFSSWKSSQEAKEVEPESDIEKSRGLFAKARFEQPHTSLEKGWSETVLHESASAPRQSGCEKDVTNSSNGEWGAQGAGKGVHAGWKRDNAAVQKMSVLFSDEESERLEEPVNTKQEILSPETSHADADENLTRLEDSLKAQTEDIQNRMTEFKQMAQHVQQTALANAKPVEQSLRELTEQVSAIREYAAHQQDHVKKLQDGYDWTIIKNFCLRIIRCIDNLENRIKRLVEQQVDTAALEEVRDELLFALESTSVEKFEPEINSDYRGQEKNTEAIREKEECDDGNLRGKIAKVLKPGYHYFIDEDNVKLVRTAQVKLYG
jgi:molecular chaperone GrpE (heat shock protein)